MAVIDRVTTGRCNHDFFRGGSKVKVNIGTIQSGLIVDEGNDWKILWFLFPQHTMGICLNSFPKRARSYQPDPSRGLTLGLKLSGALVKAINAWCFSLAIVFINC